MRGAFRVVRAISALRNGVQGGAGSIPPSRLDTTCGLAIDSVAGPILSLLPCYRLCYNFIPFRGRNFLGSAIVSADLPAITTRSIVSGSAAVYDRSNVSRSFRPVTAAMSAQGRFRRVLQSRRYLKVSDIEADATFVRFDQRELELGGEDGPILGTQFRQYSAAGDVRAHHRHTAGGLRWRVQSAHPPFSAISASPALAQAAGRHAIIRVGVRVRGVRAHTVQHGGRRAVRLDAY